MVRESGSFRFIHEINTWDVMVHILLKRERDRNQSLRILVGTPKSAAT